MLDGFRRLSKGPIAWVLFALILIPFAFFGVQGYIAMPGQGQAISFGNQSVTTDQFQRLWFNQQSRLQSLGLNTDEIEQYRGALVGNLVAQLARDELLEQLNFLGSDAALKRLVGSLEQFQDNQGQFSPELLEQFLRSQRLHFKDFELDLRQSIAFEQFEDFLQTQTQTHPQTAFTLLSQLNQSRDFSYRIFAVQDLADFESIEVSEDDIVAFYANNPSQFVKPAEVQLDYIELNLLEISESLNIHQEEVERYFEDNPSEFESYDEVKYRQILLDNSSLEQAQAIVDSLNTNPNSFGAITSNLNALQVIDLSQDWLDDRDLTPPIQALLDRIEVLEADFIQIDDRTFQIAQLIDRNPSRPSIDFQSQAKQVELHFRKQKAEAIFSEKLNAIARLNYENPSELDTISQSLNLEIQSTPFFNQSGQGLEQGDLVGNVGNLIQAAFGNLLQAGSNSSVIEIDENRSIVARIRDTRPEELQPLKEVRDDIINVLKRNQWRQQALISLQNNLEVYLKQKEENSEGWTGIQGQTLDASTSSTLGFEYPSSHSLTPLEAEVAQVAFRLNLDNQATIFAPQSDNSVMAIVVLDNINFLNPTDNLRPYPALQSRLHLEQANYFYRLVQEDFSREISDTLYINPNLNSSLGHSY